MKQNDGNVLPAGIWPVMLTPFNADLSIDWYGLDALTEWYLEAGVAGLFACCLSSEMYQLTAEERLELVSRVIKRVAGRMPVVVTGTFAADARVNAADIRTMAGQGAAAVVLITSLASGAADPAAVVTEKLLRLAEQTGDIPLGLYECPQPYKKLLATETLLTLAQSGRFRFFKDTCCDTGLLRERGAAVAGSALRVYNAHTASGLASFRTGASGLSCIAANFVPELCVSLYRAFESGDANADAIQRELSELDPFFNQSNYLTMAKHFLGRIGLPVKTFCRAPVPSVLTANDEVTLAKLGERFYCVAG